MTDFIEILHNAQDKTKMLPCIDTFTHFWWRVQWVFRIPWRLLSPSVHGLTLCYPASLLEDQDFTPWGRCHWSIIVGLFLFPLFPEACNSCSITMASFTLNSFHTLSRNVAGWEDDKGSSVSPSCSYHVGLVVLPCCEGSIPPLFSLLQWGWGSQIRIGKTWTSLCI